jgi:hypothetical protein
MSEARRLKRVFWIDIETCARCGGQLRIIAAIEESAVIAKVLAHLEKTAPDHFQAEPALGAPARPPHGQFPGGRRSARSRNKARSKN